MTHLPCGWPRPTMDTMLIQPVILAGGSGTRLWPASRRNYPKQLLALTGDHSLLQETALRLPDIAGVTVAPSPIVVTNEEYRFLVADQLREIGIDEPLVVLEPVGRNTAPALTLAALIAQEDDTLLMVMPSDHLIGDLPAFRASVVEATQQAGSGRFVTFGIVPDRPETGYGYIQVGDLAGSSPTARWLAGFREKPDAATAARFIADGGFLWNSGIFMVSRALWLSAIQSCREEISSTCRASLKNSSTDGCFVRIDRETFSACPSDSIDYAVLEKLECGGVSQPQSAEAVVIPLDAGWSDVGTWDALWAVSEKDPQGNVTRGQTVLEDTEDSLVHAGSRVVAVLGCRDVVVVDTPDAVLVAGKNRSADLKDLVARVQEQVPETIADHLRVHRPWGLFDCLDKGERYQVKHIVVRPGAGLSLQLHRHRAEHWVVVQGVAEVTCGDKRFRLVANESTYIPKDTPHRLENPGPEPLDIIEVQSGEYLGEDDIVRLDDRYGRIQG